MKIKATQVKPGMLIVRDYKLHPKVKKLKSTEYALIIAKKGLIKVEYTHFSSMDGCSGRMVGFMDGNEKVKVITNKKKKARIIKLILADVFKHLHHVNEDVDVLRLIQAMDKE